MKEKVVIFGTSFFAEVAHSYFTYESDYEVVGFTANTTHIAEKQFVGLPVIAFEEVEEYYPPDEFKMFIAVGYVKLNKTRARIYDEAKKKGYSLVSYVYPQMKIWPNNEIGENTFIFEDNTIQPFVKIGNNVVLWSGNHVGHHSQIGNHCFITSHVVISGNCQISDYCFIGVNATLRDNISIGESCIIGAGSLIMKSTQDKELYIAKRTKPTPQSTDTFTL
jgi:sugar O-acyltransferase (sialic acid O-acetyltransferase NeuD family)